jgi:hypothetical protein
MDPDSTPGNDVDQTPDEDDEAIISFTAMFTDPDDESRSGISGNNLTIKRAFPNPASNQMTIEFTSQESGIADMYIYDINGRALIKISEEMAKGFNSQQIDVSRLPSGMYFIYYPQGNGANSKLQFVKE